MSCVSGEGLEVTEYTLGADKTVQRGDTFKHTIVLSGVFGDSPALKKLARWLSHVAYLGCGFCQGGLKDGGGMYFLGYDEPVGYGAFAPFEREDYGAHSEHAVGWKLCGDECVLLSDQDQRDQRDRAGKVDRGEKLPTDVGCKGTSVFCQGARVRALRQPVCCANGWGGEAHPSP